MPLKDPSLLAIIVTPVLLQKYRAGTTSLAFSTHNQPAATECWLAAGMASQQGLPVARDGPGHDNFEQGMMPGTLEQVSNVMSSWHHGAKGMQQTVFWGTGSHRRIGLARAVVSHICAQDAVIASVGAVGLGNLSLEGHACKRSEEENAPSLQHMGSEA